ncbi:hypothetical protein [Synechococcus sp.]
MLGTLLSDPFATVAPLWRRLNRWGLAAVEINDRCLALWAPGAISATVAPLPEGLVLDGIPQNPAAVGDLLGDLVLQAGLNLRAAAALLPSGETEWRMLRLEPTAPLKEQQLALAGVDQNLALMPLAEPGEWMALLNKCQTIDRWIEVFAIADLELDFLEVAEIAQLRALGIEFGDPAAPDCLLLDLQTNESHFTWMQKGKPFYRQRLGPAGGANSAKLLAELAVMSQFHDQPLWLMGCELLQPGLAEQLLEGGNGWLQLAPLRAIGSGDPLTDAAFAGLIGTAQRVADG